MNCVSRYVCSYEKSLEIKIFACKPTLLFLESHFFQTKLITFLAIFTGKKSMPNIKKQRKKGKVKEQNE